jgi:hypothetical protein
MRMPTTLISNAGRGLGRGLGEGRGRTSPCCEEMDLPGESRGARLGDRTSIRGSVTMTMTGARLQGKAPHTGLDMVVTVRRRRDRKSYRKPKRHDRRSAQNVAPGRRAYYIDTIRLVRSSKCYQRWR